MKEIDTHIEDQDGLDDHELFMREVAQGDHELLYLDCYLGECFKKENLG